MKKKLRKNTHCSHSSDPSAQSASPSQRHRAGTHTELLHWKAPEMQVGLGQEASSEPSEQSLSLSQMKDVDIHWPLFFSSASLSQSALPSQCQLPGIHWFLGRPQLNSDC
uniref:Uncharacterized protein n=1 Tax=Anabas testudineus TaxID=64144 RepID=A0A3Q1H948_ANATE